MDEAGAAELRIPSTVFSTDFIVFWSSLIQFPHDPSQRFIRCPTAGV